MTDRFVNPIIKYTTSTLKTMPGAELYFFVTGTTTPKVTFQDFNGTIPHAHPVVALSDGHFPPIFLDGTYRAELKYLGVTQPGWPVDDIGATNDPAPLADWNSGFSYSDGDLVTGPDGNRYESLQDNNLNNDPTAPGSLFWAQVFLSGNVDSWEQLDIAARSGPGPKADAESAIRYSLDLPEASALSYVRANADGTYTNRIYSDVKADIGLSNVDNTSDINKPVSTAQAAALAPKASPVFTGNPTAPTPASNDNDTSLATTAFVKRIYAESYASIAGLDLAIGQHLILKGHTTYGDNGGGLFIGVSSVGLTPNPGTISATATGGVYAKRVSYYRYLPEMFGLKGDGVTNDSAAILAEYAVTKNIRIDSTVLNTLTIAQQGNATFRGEGSFTVDPYAKHVIPDNAKSDHTDSIDYLPSKHGRWACSVATPVVCLVGDSISTWSANTYSTGNMLTDVLRNTLDKQFPNGVTFLNRSISGQGWGSLDNDLHSASIDWYPAVGTWKARVAADNPDLIIFSFGMNDSSGIQLTAVKNAIDYFKALPKAPSIIVCTPLSPNGVSPGATPDGKTFMEGRQAAAGFTRSYVKWRNGGKDAGLLDVNRAYNKAQNGFDPINTLIRQEDTPVTGVALGGGAFLYTKTQQCSDWQVLPRWDDSNVAFSITINTGTDAGDFIQITRDATQLGIAIYAQSQLIYGAFQAHTFDNTTDTHFVIEKKGNFISIHKTNNAEGGKYTAPLFYQRLVSNGGIFDIKVTATGMNNVRIYPSEYVWNEPSLRMDQLWGIDGGPLPYGGSGFNHPSDYVGAYVYRQLIESTRFYEAISGNRFIEGSIGSGSAVSITTNTNTVVTSISLPPGDWDVSGVVGFLPAATTNMTILTVGCTDAGVAFYTPRGKSVIYNTGVIGGGGEIDMPAPTIRLDLRAAVVNTTVNLVCRATFTVSTLTAYGYIRAAERSPA